MKQGFLVGVLTNGRFGNRSANGRINYERVGKYLQIIRTVESLSGNKE